MKIFTTKNELKSILHYHRSKSENIGFVPTMGALHAGHISLIKKSIDQNDVTLASIYVNPAQFNDKNDLIKYPRNPEKDCNLLEEHRCNYIFMPDDHEMYPVPDERTFDLGILDSLMEGNHRPGHFNGVAKVVTKFFDIIQPCKAYFGQKDFQQLAVIRKLVHDLHYSVQIIACPIVREPDGLAMSSRNILLSADEREEAPTIFDVLNSVKKNFTRWSLQELYDFVRMKFMNSSVLKLEYFEIVDSSSLEPCKDKLVKKPLTACIAVFAGTTRLIDNIELIS